ncbi:MAG TPA: Clp protease N-terminal domain-containing protein [Candidatus Dormibacteraeota bacterium]|nr:Clp protease N-terminal domain-containing protein [Candidatus Dormibacteraeota bacterium]
MPRDKDFKRRVRARMRRTGESYTSARARLLGATRRPRPSRALTGGTSMYPFERFTERSKKALTLAQAEAAAAGRGYIGTEHLVLGLVTEGDGLAAIALRRMEVTDATPRLRQEIQRLQGDQEPAGSDVVAPTAEVKRAIELAFEEAARLGQDFVGTEHLLVGILTEGEGVGARVLAELGVTLDRVRQEVERLRSHPEQIPDPAPSRPVVSRSVETESLLAAAQREAAAEGVGTVFPYHVLRAMVRDRASAALLGHLGIDVEGLEQRLVHPSDLAVLRDAVQDARAKKEEAIARQDWEEAARLRDQEHLARERWAQAYRRWVRSLHGEEPAS